MEKKRNKLTEKKVLVLVDSSEKDYNLSNMNLDNILPIHSTEIKGEELKTRNPNLLELYKLTPTTAQGGSRKKSRKSKKKSRKSKKKSRKSKRKSRKSKKKSRKSKKKSRK